MDTPTQNTEIPTYAFNVRRRHWQNLQREFVTLRGPPAGEVIAAHIDAMFCNWARANGVTILDIEVSKTTPGKMVEVVGRDGERQYRAAVGDWPFTIKFRSDAGAEAFCTEFAHILLAGEGAE